ncbi:hypothetical protein B296_00029919 [Ensete ventricosum]|uniref:Uncharacterized protein n=1 Tax=Ensete ventricosum TaxID=4639 RepID=A0A426YQX9_ENSVE|nr:hypothetical protein B296_00029919 [Ensete ventricosum]
MAVGGVSCDKGAVAIGGRRGSNLHGCCRGGQQRYGARDDYYCVQFIAGRDYDIWQRTIIVGYDINRLPRKIAAGSFLLQRSLLAAIKEDSSKRSLLAVRWKRESQQLWELLGKVEAAEMATGGARLLL